MRKGDVIAVKKRLLPLLLLCTLIVGAGSVQATGSIGIIGGADGPTSIFVATSAKDDSESGEPSETEGEADPSAESDPESAEGEAEANALKTAEPVPTASPRPTAIPTPAPVSNEQIQIRVTLGYDGMLGMMRSMPVIVELTNHGPDLENVTLGVNVYESPTVYSRYDVPFSLANGATKRYSMTITPKVKQDYYAFEVVSGGRILAEERVAPSKLIAPEAVLIGLLAPETQPLTYFNIDPTVNLSLRSEPWTTVALNADNFPTSADSMRALSILVVDGVDVRTLSDAQRAALVGWMQAGGIVILGGGTQANVNYPYFAAWTGLESDGLEQVEDFSSVLAKYAQLTVPAIGQDAYRNLVVGNVEPLLSGGEVPLLFLTPVGGGVIYTATFDLSTKPMVTWSGARGLWQRLIMASAQDVYLSELDRLQSYSYDRFFYGVQNITENLPIVNTDPSEWVLVLLGVYLLVAGFGCYFLLKRLDKREWMWLTIPLCAFLTLGAILFISKSMTLNDPAAVSFAYLQWEDGKTVARGYVGVSTPETDEILVAADHTLIPYKSDNYYYYDYSEGDTPVYRPVTLQQRYIQGDAPAVGYPKDAAWSMHLLRAELPAADYGKISASLWMEGDGVHGLIENNSEFALEEGYVFTSFGYSLIEALLPGQSASFRLELTANAEQWFNRHGEVPPDTMVYNMNTANGYHVDMYSFIYSALMAKGKVQPEFTPPSSTYSAHSSMLNMCTDFWDVYNQPAVFHYVTFSDAIGQQSVTINGKAVTRTAHRALLDIKMDYQPIGPTGEVFVPAGSIVPELVTGQISNNVGRGKMTPSSYLSLNEPVELRFELPIDGKLEIDSMSLSGEYYDPLPTLSLFDHTKQEWVVQATPFVSMDADAWAPYWSEDNVLLVRYTATRTNGNYNTDIMTPRLILKGRVK